MKGKIIYEEVQSFVGTWKWYLVVGIAALSIGGTGLGLYFTRDIDGVIGLTIAGTVTLGLVILFYTSKLYTTIDQNALYYRYPPFVNKEKVIRKGDVKELHVRTYKPIREYGGWGYRFRFRSGRALNIAGNKGLQILTTNEKRIFIGTQKPELLEKAISQLKENWNSNNG